jgi:hypothetical protein
MNAQAVEALIKKLKSLAPELPIRCHLDLFGSSASISTASPAGRPKAGAPYRL